MKKVSKPQDFQPEDVTLQPVLHAKANFFYKELNNSIWEYFRQKIKVSGSMMSKLSLIQFLKQAGVEDRVVIDLLEIMNRCETVIYTDSIPVDSKKELFAVAKAVLRSIDDRLK